MPPRSPTDRPDDRGRIILARPREARALTHTLRGRRSTKTFQTDPIDLDELSQLLGVTVSAGPCSSRPYASAHGRYDVQVTVVTGAVQSLAPAVYRYLPDEHALLRCSEDGDHRARLADTTLDASWLTQCPVAVILSADLAAADRAFRDQGVGRGERFCWLEAGLITQNIYLWAAATGLGTVFIGGVDYTTTHATTSRWLPPGHSVVGILPLGRPDSPASAQ